MITLNHEAERFWELYWQSDCAVQKRRCQLLALLAEGKSLPEALQTTGYSRQGAYKILTAYKKDGIESLKDRRHDNQGAPTLLTDNELYQLALAIRDANQRWNGPSVQHWLQENLQKSVYIARCYEYLEAFDPSRHEQQTENRKSSHQVKRVLARIRAEKEELDEIEQQLSAEVLVSSD